MRYSKGRATLANGIRNGPWAHWEENGVLSGSGGYSDDKRTGLWVAWFENGKIKSSEEYKADKFDGAAAYWNEAGDLISKGQYCDGKACGEWTVFENGVGIRISADDPRAGEAHKDSDGVGPEKWRHTVGLGTSLATEK